MALKNLPCNTLRIPPFKQLDVFFGVLYFLLYNKTLSLYLFLKNSIFGVNKAVLSHKKHLYNILIMAIVSRQEFAELCGMDVKSLNVYISRRKIVFEDPGTNKKIDTEHLVNMLFKKQRKELLKQKNEKASLISSISENPRRKQQKDFTEDNDEDLPPTLDDDFLDRNFSKKSDSKDSDFKELKELTRKKLKGDAELVTVRVEKEKMLLAKAAGELLPVELALNAHRIYVRALVTAFESGVMNIANKFCHIMAGGDMTMYTKIVESCRKELSRCVSDAGGDVNRDLELMIKEFSSKNKK